MRRCFLLLAAFILGACGIKGSLEMPVEPDSPSLYERAFGKETPKAVRNAPEQDEAPEGDTVGISGKSAE